MRILMVEQIMKSACHVHKCPRGANGICCPRTNPESRFRIGIVVKPRKIVAAPLCIRSVGEMQRHINSCAEVGIRPRISRPVQAIKQLIKLFLLQIRKKRRTRTRRLCIKQLKCRNAMRRCMQGIMRTLMKLSILALHFLHHAHPFRTFHRILRKCADRIENVCRIGTAVGIDAHFAISIVVLPKPARIGTGGDAVCVDALPDVLNDRCDIVCLHTVSLCRFLSFYRIDALLSRDFLYFLRISSCNSKRYMI